MNKLETVLYCRDVSKQYQDAGKTINVLKSINLEVKTGECVAILGASGSGKTTLLQLLALLDAPSSGSISINNVDTSGLPDQRMAQIRRQHLGFIYQFHHLLPELTAIENTMMPLLIGKERIDIATSKSAALLQKLGLDRQAHQKVLNLSGGERQRVAVARALVHKPSCVLADEPTGNLDADSATKVLDLMGELQHQTNTSFIIVTHDEKVAERAHRVLHLKDGMLL